MWLKLGILLGLLSAFLAQTTVWVPFDCRRLNSDCADDIGVCNSTSGRCICGGTNPPRPGYQGFDCNLFTNDILPADQCNPRCENGGTCFKSRTGQPACYCSAEYTNADCAQRRVDVRCGTGEISIYVKPHRDSSFAGLIAVIEELDFGQERVLSDPACRREGLTTDRQPDNSFDITFPLNDSSPCFEAVQIRNLTNGDTEYTVKVRVLYRATIITSVDETHTFVCALTGNGVTGGVDVGNRRPDLGGTTVTGSVQVAQMDFLLRQGRTVVSPVNATAVVYVGQQLFTRVSLKQNARYESLVVESCEVRPTEQENASARTIFFANRCPKEDALYMVDSGVGSVRVDNGTVLIAIYAIKYTSLDTLYVSCNVSLCVNSDDARCAPANCPDHLGGPSSGFGRRKRDADEATYESVTQRMIVVGSREQLEAIRGEEVRYKYVYKTTEQLCTDNPLFIVVIAVCGLMLVIALIVASVFCRRKSCAKSKMQLE